MSHWNRIRAQAREQHHILLALTDGDSSAAALLSAAARVTDVHPMRLAPDDSLLDGAVAVLDRAAESIYYDQGTDPILLPLLLAHEYAHLWLKHGDRARCSAEQIDPEASDEDVPLGLAQVQGYSPEERREREANVYAREFLLPSGALRRWHLEAGLGAQAIATRTGLPEGMVLHQLSYALLTPEPVLAAPAQQGGDAPLPDLDDSQRKAAYEPEGPVLTEAGPGTGKTRTLVARVRYLLDRGEAADSILGLTFSIKAAEEMRERIARVAPAEAAEMVIGTFHSFGLEVLRKHGHHLGYPKRLRVLDPASALFMMERMLPELGLVHYQNLYEPTSSLSDLLGAISRAKDELRTPAEYEALARAMLERAGDEAQVERAERALEVARVYRIYQERLDAEKMVDFGDLIFRTVELLRQFPAVRAALAAQFRNILVDEYQDVNRASGALLEELAEESGGRGLWVVGDARQSIYRWRGASSANMRLFRARFPHAKIKVLEGNYRSQQGIVDVVSAFARTMTVGSGEVFVPWKAERGARGGLQRLSQHLEGLCYGSNAWGMVTRYLFERSSYIRHLAADTTVAGQQKRLALFQFLEFAHKNREPVDPEDTRDPKRGFLDYVRRLEVFGEEKQLRHLPESGASVDAVRLLTVHASKGLQFPVVYVPGLGAGSFPANRQYVACPAPEGLVRGDSGDVHDEEEECLFFVAISRAEDVLCLSRPERQGEKKSNPSRLLVMLEGALPRPPGGPATWLSDGPTPPPAASVPAGEPRVWDERALDTYMRCPKQYFYERVLGLGGLRDDAAYVQLHRCVYDIVRWLQAERAEGRVPDEGAALVRLGETWAAHGPVGHAYEKMYRVGAGAMVQKAVGELMAAGAPAERPEWEVARAYGGIRFTPDHMVFAGAGADGAPTVFRLRTGRLGSKELDKPIYGLYQPPMPTRAAR